MKSLDTLNSPCWSRGRVGHIKDPKSPLSARKRAAPSRAEPNWTEPLAKRRCWAKSSGRMQIEDYGEKTVAARSCTAARLSPHILKVELFADCCRLSAETQRLPAGLGKWRHSPSALVTTASEPSSVLHCAPFMFGIKKRFPQNLFHTNVAFKVLHTLFSNKSSVTAVSMRDSLRYSTDYNFYNNEVKHYCFYLETN